MNDTFEYQKEKLLAIKHEISLLHQQINYLLRNEKALGLLDLDVLMNRTHTIYDQLCAINLGDEATEDDFDLNPDAIAGLFGVTTDENAETHEETDPEPETIPEPEIEPEPEQEAKPEPTLQPEMPAQEEPAEEEAEVETPKESAETLENPLNETNPAGDEFGFFFRFEDVEEEQPAADDPVEIDGKLVHTLEEVPEEAIPERDRVNGDELVTDNPLEMPKMDDELPENEGIKPEPLPFIDPEPIVEQEPIVEPEPQPIVEPEPEPQTPAAGSLSDYFGADDTGFELSTPETIGERMMRDDHSLAAKFQQNPVRDLREVIGINDKFLFVNELFGGSMEKYNKSIENLNDLKTLNGAMIYLNELKIELQWNSSNEAYQKLADLVRRKFERS